MHIKSDTTKCDGFASCVIVAPDVFGLSDDNVVEILDENPPEARRADVEEAIRNCPRNAIWLAEQ